MRAGDRREAIMTGRDRAAGIVLILGLMAGVVWGSNAAMATHRAPDARLRLAWSARPERIEKCRQQSEEELERLPAHMRQAVACEGTTAEYRLQLRIEGALVSDRVVHGGGLRRDRRLYVFDEAVVPAGEVTIDVRFDRLDVSEPAAGERDGERHERTPVQREEVPAHLALTRRVRLSSREVILVTYDADRHELMTVQGLPRATQ